MLPSSRIKPEGHSSDSNQESTYNDAEEANPGMSKDGSSSVLQKSNQRPTRLLSATRKKTDSSRKDLLSVAAMQDVLEAVRAENEMVDDVGISSKEDRGSMAIAGLVRTGLSDSTVPSTDSVAPRTGTGSPRTGRKSIEGAAHTEKKGGSVTFTNRLTAEDGQRLVDSNSPRVRENRDSTSSSPLVSPAVDNYEDTSSQLCSVAGKSQAEVSQAGESQVGKYQTEESQAGESQAGESQAGESQAGESQAGESQAGESQAGESQASKLPHKSMLVIKPVLLNYSHKPSSKNLTTTVLKPELKHTHMESGGAGEGLASQSLTEHTLKVITERVRNMNSK